MINARLLHAAARGARINWLNDDSTYGAYAAGVIDLDHTDLQSIHPEDLHLQYGPISSALRDRVINGPWADGFQGAWYFCADYFGNWYWTQRDDELLTTLLIIAEYFADEGM